jgi:nucleoside-diphosphate-sugar epimerase
MAREFLSAQEAGRVQVAIGRASDYFGPRGGAQSILGDRVIPAALVGKTATVIGDPDQPHTYTYIPDVGEGLATLGEHPDAPGEVWHLPTTPRPRPPATWSTPSTSSPASPRPSSAAPQHSCCEPSASSTRPSGELLELQYEFQEPFIVDSTKIATKLDVHATPPDQALADTVASYRTTTS